MWLDIKRFFLLYTVPKWACGLFKSTAQSSALSIAQNLHGPWKRTRSRWWVRGTENMLTLPALWRQKVVPSSAVHYKKEHLHRRATGLYLHLCLLSVCLFLISNGTTRQTTPLRPNVCDYPKICVNKKRESCECTSSISDHAFEITGFNCSLRIRSSWLHGAVIHLYYYAASVRQRYRGKNRKIGIH